MYECVPTWWHSAMMSDTPNPAQVRSDSSPCHTPYYYHQEEQGAVMGPREPLAPTNWRLQIATPRYRHHSINMICRQRMLFYSSRTDFAMRHAMTSTVSHMGQRRVENHLNPPTLYSALDGPVTGKRLSFFFSFFFATKARVMGTIRMVKKTTQVISPKQYWRLTAHAQGCQTISSLDLPAKSTHRK